MKFKDRLEAYKWMRNNVGVRVLFDCAAYCNHGKNLWVNLSSDWVLLGNVEDFLSDSAHNFRTEGDDKQTIDWCKVAKEASILSGGPTIKALQELVNQLMPILEERYKK